MGNARAAAAGAMRWTWLLGLVLVAMVAIRVGVAHAVAGDLDPTFGVAGKAIPVIPGASSVGVNALAIQSDGKIVCLGDYVHLIGGDRDFILFRLLSNGVLDTSFGLGGWVTTDFGGEERAMDLVIQGDGKLVAVGRTDWGSGGLFAVLARYNGNGTLDTTFGAAGKSLTPYSSYWEGVALQSDGKIVVAGYTDFFPGGFSVARFTTEGDLDGTFDMEGIASLGSDGFLAYDVTIDGNGKIVATGYDAGNLDFTTARFNNDDGTLNTTFGYAGVSHVDIDGDHDEAKRLAIDGAGRIYLAGWAECTDDEAAVVVRLTSSGNLDNTFGNQGKAIYPVADYNMAVRGLTLDPMGRPVVSGFFLSPEGGAYEGSSWLIRFTGDGMLDHGFGVDGLMVVSHGSYCSFTAGVCSDPQGRLLCGGVTDGNPIVTRHQSDDHSTLGSATWWWSDPERNDKYLVDPGLVTIHANAYQDLWNCQRLQAPMFYRDLPGGSHWSVTTLVYVPSQNQDTLAGLMVWNGAGSGAVHALYVGLADVLGTPWVIAQGSIPENCAAALPYASYALEMVVVGIVRSGNDYTFSYAPPFGAWVEMGTITTTADFSKVGFMAKTWSTNDIEAQFSFFNLVRPGVTSSLDLLLHR